MLDYSLWGLDGTGYHLQNIFWHILTVIAVYRCMLLFKINVWCAFLLSLAFSVHPQRVESVVWISERKDVMCAAFYLWSFFYYIKESQKNKFPLKALILFFLAIISKSMAISLPLILLSYEVLILKNMDAKTLLKKLAPFFAIFLIFIPVTVFSQIIPETKFSLPRQLFAIVHNLLWYLQKTVVPCQLSPIYPKIIFSYALTVKIALALTFLVALLFVSFRKNKNLFMSRILPLISFFCISIAPVIGFFPLGAIDYADRYSYIPSVFIWMILGIYITESLHLGETRNTEKPRMIYHHPIFSLALGGIYISILALMTFIYSGSWRDYYSILKISTMHNPPSYMALGALGDMELYNGNYEEAIKAADMIIQRTPGWEAEEGYRKIILKAEGIKGVALYRKGKKNEAAKYFESIYSKTTQTFFADEKSYADFITMLNECRIANGKMTLERKSDKTIK